MSLVPIVWLRLSTDSGDCESVDAVVRVNDEDDGDTVVSIDSHCVEAVNGMATTARRLTVSLCCR